MRILQASPKTVTHLPELHALHDPIVRDLAWVMAAPTLLDAEVYGDTIVSDAWCAARWRLDAPRLALLDAAPQPLHDFIAARPTRRLGHYFESLMAYWLTHIAAFDVVARNLPVRDAQRTVGEFDFVLRDEAARVCHWEVAVKFYLQRESLPESRVFLGPAGQDRLDLKLDRVFSRQLALSQTEAGRAALPCAVERAQAYIKGYLFYPPDTLQAPIHGLSSQHLRAWWIRHGQLLPQSQPDTRWVVLPRLRWLAPARLPADAPVMDDAAIHAALSAHFAQCDEPLLLAELQADHTGRWDEVARGFVVGAKWGRGVSQTCL